MVQNIICPKRSHSISISWQLAHPARNLRERQNHNIVLLRLQSWEHFSALNTGVFTQTNCSGLQEIRVFLLAFHWAAGCSWKCCFLSTHSSFPIWNMRVIMLTSFWDCCESSSEERLFTGWMAFQSSKNPKIRPWFHDSLIHHVSQLCPAAGKYFSVRVVFATGGCNSTPVFLKRNQSTDRRIDSPKYPWITLRKQLGDLSNSWLLNPSSAQDIIRPMIPQRCHCRPRRRALRFPSPTPFLTVLRTCCLFPPDWGG